jgi:hypothetical protein
VTHYARAIAHAVLGDVAAAEASRVCFEAATKRVQPTRTIFEIRVIDILNVARAMIDGELAYRARRFDAAWLALRDAVRISDSLPYDEPWGWMTPPRHALGALLLEQVGSASALFVAVLTSFDVLSIFSKHTNLTIDHNQFDSVYPQGHARDAVAVLAADLGLDEPATLPPAHRHPNNIFALVGYEAALASLAADGDADAGGKLVDARARLAQARKAGADDDIVVSCFCAHGRKASAD